MPAGEPTRLRVATLNTWGLTEGLSRHLGPRMDAIAEALPRLEPDLVALQECWTTSGRERLIGGFRRAGLTSVWHRPAAFGGSGLLLLSRRPLGRVRFHRFRLCGLPERIDHGDYWAGKGVAVATIETRLGRVAVLNTHLVARYGVPWPDRYYGHRVAEIVEIATLLSDIRLPVIALGDFNLGEHAPEYRILTGLTGLQDVAATLDRRQHTVIAPHPYRPVSRSARIDYVWVRPGAERSLAPISIRRVLDEPLRIDGEPAAYSDHAGLLAELELRVAPGERPPVGRGEARSLALAALVHGEGVGAERAREQNLGATLAAAGAIGTLTARRLTRRRLLRAALVGAAGACGLGAGVGALLGPDESGAYREIRAQLEKLPMAGGTTLR